MIQRTLETRQAKRAQREVKNARGTRTVTRRKKMLRHECRPTVGPREMRAI